MELRFKEADIYGMKELAGQLVIMQSLLECKLDDRETPPMSTTSDLSSDIGSSGDTRTARCALPAASPG